MELENLRKRRIEALQNKILDQQNKEFQEQIQLQQQIGALENIVKPYLTREALTRYGALKTVHTEKAAKVLVLMAQLIQAGKLNEKIDDNSFKELLKKLDQNKREVNIKRV